MGELLTIKHTATRIGIAESTLWEWIRERGLPVHTVPSVTGQRRKCDWDEVEQWITAQADIAAPPEPGRLLRYARGMGWNKTDHRMR
jgi:predicted DNA-binding transcriptional regulator AlpA